MTTHNFILAFEKTKFRINQRSFDSLLAKGIELLKKKPLLKGKMNGGTIEVSFIDDKKIQSINQKYRDKNKPTDVVSLSYLDEIAFPGKKNIVGEIFISVDTAAKQAREHQKTLDEELEFLFAHGLLHVFGYDHETPEERKIMFDFQDQILGTQKWRELAEKPFKKS